MNEAENLRATGKLQPEGMHAFKSISEFYPISLGYIALEMDSPSPVEFL